jgi:hypothetical protein
MNDKTVVAFDEWTGTRTRYRWIPLNDAQALCDFVESGRQPTLDAHFGPTLELIVFLQQFDGVNLAREVREEKAHDWVRDHGVSLDVPVFRTRPPLGESDYADPARS